MSSVCHSKYCCRQVPQFFFNFLLVFIFYFNCWALDKIKDIAIDWLVTVYRNMSGHYASVEETCSLYTNNVQPYIVLKKVEDLYVKLMSKFKIPNLHYRYQFIFKPTLWITSTQCWLKIDDTCKNKKIIVSYELLVSH